MKEAMLQLAILSRRSVAAIPPPRSRAVCADSLSRTFGAASEGLVQIVEDHQRALDPFVVAFCSRHQTVEHQANSGSFGACELRVLQIEIVHDLGDGSHALIRQ